MGENDMSYQKAYQSAMEALAWLSGYIDPALNPDGIDHTRLLYLRDKIAEMAQTARNEISLAGK